MNLFILVGFFAVAACMDVPQMIKSKQWRSLILYAVFFIAVFTVGLLIEFDVTIPSPIKAIQHFYQYILHLSFKQ